MSEDNKEEITTCAVVLGGLLLFIGLGFLLSYWVDLHQINHCKRQIENNMKLEWYCVQKDILIE